MAKRIRQAVFKFKPFSNKQLKILSWWVSESPVHDKDGIIADGAIRSGKSLAMSLSYVMWAMDMYDNQIFGMCGKTIGAFRRNVLFWLKLMLKSRGYKIKEQRSENLIIISKNGVINYFYLFGGKDERSQDLIQGVTLAGCFFDEVVLMPESFVNQAVGRCSVAGSKYWFNCNPGHPGHWFKRDWIDLLKGNIKPEKYQQLINDGKMPKDLIYLRFTMDDNLSLTDAIKNRYKSSFSGVFYDRYIKGLWVAAEGVIYRQFADNPESFIIDKPPDIMFSTIGIDFGGNRSAHAFNHTGYSKKFTEIVTLDEFHSKKEYDPTQLIDEFVAFLERQLSNGYKVIEIYCDSAEPVLIRGIRNALVKKKIGVPVSNAKKGPVNDRVNFYSMMMACGCYKVMKHCECTINAFSTALWNSKVPDERLDDGTTNIDSLDAQEYSTEPYQQEIIDIMMLGN